MKLNVIWFNKKKIENNKEILNIFLYNDILKKMDDNNNEMNL